MTLRRGVVYFKNDLAGMIEETDTGYCFTYDTNFLNSPSAHPVSVSLPLQEDGYQSTILHPFFDGLIPEGWVLSIVIKNWKIDPRDRMGLLLTVCEDCIGAVSVKAHHE